MSYMIEVSYCWLTARVRQDIVRVLYTVLLYPDLRFLPRRLTRHRQLSARYHERDEHTGTHPARDAR